jgi:hypothetical protein
LPIGNGHDDAGRLTISAARPAAAKPNEADPAAEAALAARLWERATEISPTSPWRAVVQEFGINSALAVDHFRHRSLPHVAPAAVERWVEATTAS